MTMRRLLVDCLFLILFLAACGATSSTTTVVGDTTDQTSSGSVSTSATSVFTFETGEFTKEVFPDLGREHLSDDDTAAVIAGTLAQPEYNSVPPTSGTHSPFWAQCGVYLQAIPDIVQVHSLEHGAVLIQYNPDIDPADISALEAFAREKDSHVVVAPNPDEVSFIVVTAWTVRMELSTLDLVAVEAFWLDYANEGPERVACPFEVDEAAGQAA